MMLPHHQAAIDMAKTQLIYGKGRTDATAGAGDHHRPAIRDRVMQLWLKQQESKIGSKRTFPRRLRGQGAIT